MIRNFLLPAFRNIRKNKLYTIIHVAGLAIGIASFAFIQLYIDSESGYDSFHTHKENIYRVQQDRFNKGELSMQTVAGNAGVGFALLKNFPEVKRQVQIIKMASVLQYADISFKEERLAMASYDFFNVFSFHLTEGIDSLVLKEPYSVVLSQSAAKRYFKNENPIGKLMNWRGKLVLKVTGIYDDMPENSHFKFDVIVSYETYYKFKARVVQFVRDEPWRWDGFYTYLLLRDGADVEALEKKIPKLIEKETGDWLRETNQDLKLKLQPLSTIHLESSFNDEFEPNGDSRNIHYLHLVALFLIVIAWINYIILTTAKSVERGKEVGIRKVLGSFRRELVIQFLLEAFVLNFIGLVFATLLLYLLAPSFNDLIHRSISVFSVWHFKTFLYFGIMLIGGTLISGFYPAWVLSSFKPILILKGKFSASFNGKILQKTLVIIPFSAAIILLTSLYVIYHQVTFLKSQSLGFSLQQKLVIRDSEIYDSLYASRLASFKAELIRLPGINQSTYVANVPGTSINSYSNSVRRLAADVSDVNQYKYIAVDENFAAVFNLRVLAGRNFSHEDRSKKDILINESACKLLGYGDVENSVGEEIIFSDDTVRIKGVVNDFYHESPKNQIQPTVYVFNPDGGRFFIVPVETANTQSTIKDIEKLFNSVFPNQPFAYFFLDDKYNNQYQSEVQFGKIMGIFSMLLLIVTALGLFGLSVYSASVRSKEMGIRKILGASETTVIVLFFREYLILIVIACCIAVPVCVYLSLQWLEGFAKKIELGVFLFLIPCILIGVFTLITISFQGIVVAFSNPIKMIREE